QVSMALHAACDLVGDVDGGCQSVAVGLVRRAQSQGDDGGIDRVVEQGEFLCRHLSLRRVQAAIHLALAWWAAAALCAVQVHVSLRTGTRGNSRASRIARSCQRSWGSLRAKK